LNCKIKDAEVGAGFPAVEVVEGVGREGSKQPFYEIFIKPQQFQAHNSVMIF